jgi:hypothetical protein
MRSPSATSRNHPSLQTKVLIDDMAVRVALLHCAPRHTCANIGKCYGMALSYGGFGRCKLVRWYQCDSQRGLRGQQDPWRAQQ